MPWERSKREPGRGWTSCQPQLLGTVTLGRMPGSSTDECVSGVEAGRAADNRMQSMDGWAQALWYSRGKEAGGSTRAGSIRTTSLAYSAETVCIRDCRNCSSQSGARHGNPSLRGSKGGVTARRLVIWVDWRVESLVGYGLQRARGLQMA